MHTFSILYTFYDKKVEYEYLEIHVKVLKKNLHVSNPIEYMSTQPLLS